MRHREEQKQGKEQLEDQGESRGVWPPTAHPQMLWHAHLLTSHQKPHWTATHSLTYENTHSFSLCTNQTHIRESLWRLETNKCWCTLIRWFAPGDRGFLPRSPGPQSLLQQAILDEKKEDRRRGRGRWPIEQRTVSGGRWRGHMGKKRENQNKDVNEFTKHELIQCDSYVFFLLTHFKRHADISACSGYIWRCSC